MRVTKNTKVIFVPGDTDFRYGIPGLTAMCKNLLKKDPPAGQIISFRNKARNKVRFLCRDKRGTWLLYYALFHGTINWWPMSAGKKVILTAKRLRQIFGDVEGIELDPVIALP